MSTGVSENALRQLFKSVDSDSSGFIDEKELAAVVDLDPVDLKTIFKELDTNCDGKISIDEFINNYKQFQKLAAELDRTDSSLSDNSNGRNHISEDSIKELLKKRRAKSRNPQKGKANLRRRAEEIIG